jgi:putative cell wall-binding protein
VKGRGAIVAICLLVSAVMPGPAAARTPTSDPALAAAATQAVEDHHQNEQDCSTEKGLENLPVGAIRIDGSAATTASAAVTLSLPARSECARITAVRLSNDGDAWRTVKYSPTVDWSLLDRKAGGSATTGTRSVWAQWSDADGRWSTIERASIVYVPVKPHAVGYSIQGTVTGPGSTPLEGIAVGVYEDTPTATTDASGNYSIDGLLDGDYTVYFDDETDYYLDGYWDGSGFTYDYSEAAYVSISGADVIDIDVEMPLAPHISGHVEDLLGNPLEDITVVVGEPMYFGVETYTDASGDYDFAVPAGTWVVTFYDETGHYVDCHYDTDTPTTNCNSDSDEADSVDVGTSDVALLEIHMTPAARISGTVTTAGVGGLPDENVYLMGLYGYVVSSTLTDADGYYELWAAPGTYWISVETSHAAPLSGYYTTYLSSHATSSWGAATFFTVGSTNITGMNMQLPLAKHITGTVTGNGGVPLQDVYVEADFGAYSVYAYTNSSGNYDLSVRSGQYTVYFWANDPYLHGYYGPSGFTTDWSSAASVTIGSGGASGIDVQMTAGHTISGTITDPADDPFSDVEVTAISDGYTAWTWPDAGDYSLTVPNGTYVIYLSSGSGDYLPGYLKGADLTLDPADADETTVSGSDITGKNHKFQDCAHISGTITVEFPGNGILVDAISTSGDYLAEEYAGFGIPWGLQGGYRIPVPDGDYMVTFSGRSDVVAGFYRSTGFTSTQASATIVSVSSDVVLTDMEIPANGKVTRLGGAGRFATAAAISAQTFSPGVSVAYIAYAYNFPDALAGAAAAGWARGPVLLANTTGPLDAATVAELTRLKPYRIAVLGSTGVISESVRTALTPYARSGIVQRLAGAGRFATAAAVSAATFDPGVEVAYIAYAYNFPDALAGAAAAGWIRGPVLLANTTGPLDAATAIELTRLKPYRIVVLGSAGVISEAVKSSLVTFTQSGAVTRFSGAGRFATAAAVSAATFAPEAPDVAYVAYAYNFPDALAGAAAAGTYYGPVLLVNTTGTIDASTAAELTRLKPYRIVVLGSTGVISASVATQLAAYATAP